MLPCLFNSIQFHECNQILLIRTFQVFCSQDLYLNKLWGLDHQFQLLYQNLKQIFLGHRDFYSNNLDCVDKQNFLDQFRLLSRNLQSPLQIL
jgi:hypothetical protein